MTTTFYLLISDLLNVRQDYVEEQVAKGADTIEVFAIPSNYENSRYWDSWKHIYYHEEEGDIKFV